MARKARKALTENSVLFLKSDPTVQVFADKVGEDGQKIPKHAPKGTKRIMRITDSKDPFDGKPFNVYKLEDCIHPDLDTVDGVVKFLNGHNNLPASPRSGYDSFFNDGGPTNPQSPRNLSTKGSFRNLLVNLQALYLKAAEGGQAGEDALKYIALIPEYGKIAAEQVKTALEAVAKQAVVQKAKEMDIDPDELAEFLAQRAAKKAAAAGNVPPAATLENAADETDDDETEEEDIIEVLADEEESETESESAPVVATAVAPILTKAQRKAQKKAERAAARQTQPA